MVIAAIFGLMFSVLPTIESDDPDVMFKRKMTKLIISWLAVIGILFGFLPVEWYIFIIFVGLCIIGAILTPFLIINCL